MYACMKTDSRRMNNIEIKIHIKILNDLLRYYEFTIAPIYITCIHHEII